ncbi:MAG: MarR family winged helix-turn-helix transcriptional regulator, partial [Acidobacteriota bacterium]
IVRAIDLHSRHLVERFSVTGPQLIALQELARLGQVPVGVLARNVHVSHPTMTGILDRLEKRGLARRTRDTEDRRRITVTATPEGLKLLDDAPSPLQDRFRSEFARLDEWEQTHMLATLQRIAAMMDAEELEAAPVLTTGAVTTPIPPESAPQQDTAAERPTVGASDDSRG